MYFIEEFPRQNVIIAIIKRVCYIKSYINRSIKSQSIFVFYGTSQQRQISALCSVVLALIEMTLSGSVFNFKLKSYDCYFMKLDHDN